MDMTQIGVRTRARALNTAVASESSGPVKRRKVGGEETELSSSSVQFKRCRQVTDNSVSAGCLTDPDDCTLTLTPTASLQVMDQQQESVGIENLTSNFDCRERRETTPVTEFRAETEEMESTSSRSMAQSTVEKMPSQTELEEFFDAAEKDLQKKFAEKYNFDIAKDKPLEGRYEWVRLKP